MCLSYLRCLCFPIAGNLNPSIINYCLSVIFFVHNGVNSSTLSGVKLDVENYNKNQSLQC